MQRSLCLTSWTVCLLQSNTLALIVKAVHMVLGMESYGRKSKQPPKKYVDIEIEDDAPKRKPSLEEIDALEANNSFLDTCLSDLVTVSFTTIRNSWVKWRSGREYSRHSSFLLVIQLQKISFFFRTEWWVSAVWYDKSKKNFFSGSDRRFVLQSSEYIVIPGGEPAELLPRCSEIVAQQLELVGSYQLAAENAGTELNPRLQVLPHEAKREGPRRPPKL